MKVKSKKNILLTGGSGFIGKNIIEQLSQKHVIFAPPEKKLDLLDQAAVERFFKKRKFDVIIHTANIGVYKAEEKPNETTAKNIVMFFNIAKQLTLDQKMIFLGSGAEYDKSQDITLVTEDKFGKNIPKDSYGFAKYVCSNYIEHSKNIINLRCFGVYGKYEQPTRFISSAIISALKGKPITIHQNAFFDYLYIDDLINIIDYFVSHDAKHRSYNTVSGTRVDLITLATLINLIIKSKKEMALKEKGLANEYTANNLRLKKEITNLTLTTPEKGIKKLLAYYKKNRLSLIAYSTNLTKFYFHA